MAVIARVRPAGGFDRYGDPIAGSTRVTLDGAFVAPRVSEDVDDRGRQGVIVGLTLYAPWGTDLVHTDQVEVDGELFDVDGEIGKWDHPMTGWKPGVTAALDRAAG